MEFQVLITPGKEKLLWLKNKTKNWPFELNFLSWKKKIDNVLLKVSNFRCKHCLILFSSRAFTGIKQSQFFKKKIHKITIKKVGWRTGTSIRGFDGRRILWGRWFPLWWCTGHFYRWISYVEKLLIENSWINLKKIIIIITTYTIQIKP